MSNNVPPFSQQEIRIEKFNSIFTKNQLKVVHWNCNSLYGKIEEFKLYLKQFEPDFVSLNEIKLNVYMANLIFNGIVGYQCIYKCRNSNGGGVAMLIKNTIQFEKCDEIERFEDEIVGVSFKFDQVNAYIFSYYNPPTQSLNKDIFNFVQEKFENYLICGDLNARTRAIGCIGKNNNGNILEDILLSNNCSVINDSSPTFHRHDNNYHELLDLLIGSSSFLNACESCTLVDQTLLDSDHSAISATFKIKITSSEYFVERPSNVELNNIRLNYTRANWNQYQKLLSLSSFDQNADIEIMNKRLNDTLYNAALSSIPQVSQIQSSGNSSLPKVIIDLIKIKRKWQRLYYKNKDEETKTKYYLLKNIIKEEIARHREQKWKFFLDRLPKNPVSTKPFWQKINKIRKKKDSNIIPTLYKDNVEYKTDSEKAFIFATKLQSTFNESNVNSFDRLAKEKIDDEINNKKFYEKYDDKNVIPFSLGELKEAVHKLNNKCSTDQFNISNRLIKNAPTNIMQEILKLFNKCLGEHKIPKSWKSARISMIPKNSSTGKSDPNNYRPISITPCLAKLFEKLLAARLNDFLQKNKIIIEFQSGFRKHRQTRDNIFYLVQKAAESFARKKKLLCIFFDFASAFDKVWHNGLIFKLIQIKLPFYLLVLLIDFLHDRKFCVKIGDFVTEEFDIHCGVPQGAVLSPTLFSIFINDIPLNIKKNQSGSLLFADDLAYFQIYRKKSQALKKQINKHMKSLEMWSNSWRLSFAPKKCNYIVFSNAKKENDSNKFHIELNNQIIATCDNPKFLGIRFDKRLTFVNQINYLKETCVDRLKIIKILAHKSWHLSKQTLILIYNTLVRSVMEYSAILKPLLSTAHLNQLQVIQNNALRTILKKDYYTRILDLHVDANIKILPVRLDELRFKYIHKAFLHHNPLINNLKNEFLNFKNGRNLQFNTLFYNII